MCGIVYLPARVVGRLLVGEWSREKELCEVRCSYHPHFSTWSLHRGVMTGTAVFLSLAVTSTPKIILGNDVPVTPSAYDR